MEDEIYKLILEKPDCCVQIIKARYRDFYEKIDKTYSGSKFSEKLYIHYNGKVTCKLCGNDTTFMSFQKGYREFCSAKCSNAFNRENLMEKHSKWVSSKHETKECLHCGKEFDALISRNSKYCSNSCSTTATGNSEERLQKIRNTKLEKYGDAGYTNRKKQRQTNLERYGFENAAKSEEIKNKIKVTNLEKYGAHCYFQSDIGKEKIKQSSRITFYKNVIRKIINHTNIEPLFSLENYKGTDKSNLYKFKCKDCKNVFYDHVDSGTLPRCLVCNPLIIGNRVSKAELEIREYILKLGLQCEYNNTTVLSGKELDIYIPSKNIAIEYDGLYWHSELVGGKDKMYHANKTEICRQQGIRLIHIFEDEWINKQTIVTTKLKHILGENNKKIYARKCDVKEISSKDKSEFLEENHIQGNDVSSIRIGAYHADELVAVITFGKLRTALGQKGKEGHYELLRFATKKSVVGIASKLFKYFKTTYKPVCVVSYCDLRYGTGKVYTHMGFKYKNTTDPNYWYFKTGINIRYHRYNFAKHKLKDKLDKFDPELTEWQNMQLNGYDRIWDCGNLKFEWKA